jgi:peptidyl-tRNA hydrolase
MRPAEEYVLKPFLSKFESEVKIMVEKSADAIDSLLTHGIDYTMNHFNS